jgi:hypothetical protein
MLHPAHAARLLETAAKLSQTQKDVWELSFTNSEADTLTYIDPAKVIDQVREWARLMMGRRSLGSGRGPNPILVTGYVKVRRVLCAPLDPTLTAGPMEPHTSAAPRPC